MGVGAGLYTCMLSSYKSSRSLPHLLMSSCKTCLEHISTVACHYMLVIIVQSDLSWSVCGYHVLQVSVTVAIVTKAHYTNC